MREEIKYTTEQIEKALNLCPKYKMMSPACPERDDYHPTEMTLIEVDMFLFRLNNPGGLVNSSIKKIIGEGYSGYDPGTFTDDMDKFPNVDLDF